MMEKGEERRRCESEGGWTDVWMTRLWWLVEQVWRKWCGGVGEEDEEWKRDAVEWSTVFISVNTCAGNLSVNVISCV